MSPTKQPREDHRPFDPANVDAAGFYRELQDLRREIEAKLGPEDLAHLYKIERLGRAATTLGLLAAPFGPNLLSAAGLGLGRSTRWLLMHHVGHRGYDKVPGVPARYTSKVFARGARRMLDWADWMVPEAWIYEHNVLHHSHTGEEKDPDLIERNTAWLRASKMPVPLKAGLIALLGLSWRPFYYAPNTLKAYLERGKGPGEAEEPGFGWELWKRCYLPYAALNFGALPLLYSPFGPFAVLSALANSVLADVITNAHTFLVVGPNHTGEDLYRFEDRPGSKAEAMLRQVVGSVNYATGTELVDFAQLWLNYQIEHHIFPDMPMLRYREMQPRVRALCEKYGVPYVQEDVLTRARKMLEVAVGKASMRVAPPRGAQAAPAPAA